MKRRDVLRAAAVSPLIASVRARAEEAETLRDAGPATPPTEEKLNHAKREIAGAMAKVRLDNADGPDLLPRLRRRK
jgi:hypothetical protein